MEKQAVILISALLLLSMVVIPAVNISQSSAEPKEGSPFDDEPLWDVNVSEEQVLVAAVEDDQVLALNETSLYLIEENGEVRWNREFNETIWYRRVGRPRNIDGYLMTLKEEEDMELTLHRIDLENGSSMWEKSLDSYTVNYQVSEDNNVYIISEKEIIKISESGEELWNKEIDLGFAFSFYSRLDSDGNLIGVNAGWGVEDNNILCISSEGELKWEIEIEEQEFYRGITSDLNRDSIYLLNDQIMYKLDADEEVVWSRNYLNLEDVRDFTVIDERIYVLTFPDNRNSTLSEISDDGKELWNTTMELEKHGHNFHQWMDVGSDERIYFGNLNFTDGMQKIEDVYTFDLDGTLRWEHQFEKNLTHFPQVSDSGTIYISTWEGNVYAFRREDEQDTHFLLDYFWVLLGIIAAVIIISIVALKLKEGRIDQDTYEEKEEERPTIGEERYQHRPHEWDYRNRSEGDTFDRVHEEEFVESDTEDDGW